jgi:hypothetical protein
MKTYKLLKGGIENKEYGVIRFNENGTITSFLFDKDNTDYQEYLKWLEEGNTPLPADEISE